MGLISGDQAVELIYKVSKEIRDSNYRHQLSFFKDPIKIVSEGDSWFHFPAVPILKDIINQLIYMDESPYAIYSTGYPGDDLLKYVSKDDNGKLRGDVVDALITENPGFLLLSGGGNDILRSDEGGMENIIKPVDPAEPGRAAKDYLNDHYLNTLLPKLMGQFTLIFDHVKFHHPQCKILTHSYSYLQPRGDDYVEKPLRRPLARGGIGINETDLPGVNHKQLMTKITREVIDEFHQRLIALAGQYANVHVVDCRDELEDSDWFDEGHPNSGGCHKIACLFEDKILELLGLDQRPVLEPLDPGGQQ